MWGIGVHAILRPLKEVTAAVARALGETRSEGDYLGMPRSGGRRVDPTLGKEEYGRRRIQKKIRSTRSMAVAAAMQIADSAPP